MSMPHPLQPGCRNTRRTTLVSQGGFMVVAW